MAQDPRKFLVQGRDCPPSEGPMRNRQKEFYDTLGKIGDLEVLNEVDGRIGKGLRTLRRISDNVRNNAGPVPSIIRQTGEAVLDAGADFVLDTVGINSRETRTRGVQFSPQVANRALGQARSIYDSVRNGQFDEFDEIPTAIAEFSNLEQLLRSVFTGSPTREDRFSGQCISPYARDLIERAPKHKFMFVVEFILNEPYASRIGGDVVEELAFVIKRTTRPNVSFDYEEINFYNYRSEVLKRRQYQPMTMSFYDDHNGNTITFWDQYLRALSPASNRSALSALQSEILEKQGMDFASGSSAGTSSLDDNTKTVIKQINLYHVYKAGSKYDLYIFVSPKITELQLDDLDMTTSGEGTEVGLTFIYDALVIDAAIPMDEDISKQLEELTDAGQYALKPAPAPQGPQLRPRITISNPDRPGISTETFDTSTTPDGFVEPVQNVLRDPISGNNIAEDFDIQPPEL